MTRSVTLVDTHGNALGECPILEAHASPGKLHSAFSAYVFSTNRDQLLLQRRDMHKLFGGMWANTCCSHPFENESAVDAGQRRVREELGITCELRNVGSLIYQANDPEHKGSEHELDVLLVGEIDPSTPVHADTKEVAEWKWMDVQKLQEDMTKHPEQYAPWFHLGLPRVLEKVTGY